jgi:hypothetical protein
MPVSAEALKLANEIRSFLCDHSVESVRIHPYISVLLLCLPGEPKAGDYSSDLVIDKPLLKDEILRLLKLTEGPEAPEETSRLVITSPIASRIDRRV